MLMKDKVCVVTGAASASGIGRATAELLAANGADVVMLDMSDAIQAAACDIASRHEGRTIIGYQCDITSPVACTAAAQKVSRRFPKINALIHCAGLIKSGRYDEIEPQDFDLVVAVNLTGSFNIAKAFAPTLIASGKGSIINLASVAGQRGGGLVGGAHYAASKGGVLGLTKSLARELGPQGVRANAVCPSLIETGFVTGSVSTERIRDLTSSIPLGRPGLPEEVASVCMFLASDLSSYITGATLDVNGGSHIH
ncbi:SDR family NAD(P)-dependent oxidoreductase [Falsirhodobacter xinxiangensis]|uniref:SDR family NAD(P)-dependent oxidoreductase n=1 Tax=Falsirhodobacter xinxiangensis TaxID=2530049 RepID=UPI0010AAA343|nr:SDR family NAD(P)-dependent oxidoreductase [Rhodobacter xinxiangensis]